MFWYGVAWLLCSYYGSNSTCPSMFPAEEALDAPLRGSIHSGLTVLRNVTREAAEAVGGLAGNLDKFIEEQQGSLVVNLTAPGEEAADVVLADAEHTGTEERLPLTVEFDLTRPLEYILPLQDHYSCTKCINEGDIFLLMAREAAPLTVAYGYCEYLVNIRQDAMDRTPTGVVLGFMLRNEDCNRRQVLVPHRRGGAPAEAFSKAWKGMDMVSLYDMVMMKKAVGRTTTTARPLWEADVRKRLGLDQTGTGHTFEELHARLDRAKQG